MQQLFQPGTACAAPKLWSHYFAGHEHSSKDRRAQLLTSLRSFFAGNGQRFLLDLKCVTQGLYTVTLDYQILLAAFQAYHDSGGLVASLELKPDEGLTCLAAAAHEVLSSLQGEEFDGLRELTSTMAIRLTNHTPSTMHIRQLKSNTIGRLATITGTIVRMTPVRPLIIGMDFTCAKCGSTNKSDFPDGTFAQPTRCSSEGCRCRTFTPRRSSAVCMDWQKVRMQELAGAGPDEQQGQVPKCVDVELRHELVASCVVGDVVTVTALVRVIATSDNGRGGKAQQGLFLIYLEALSVVHVSALARRGAASASEAESALLALEGGPAGCAWDSRQPPQISAECEQQAWSVPPNVPDFTTRDLQFIIKFTQEAEGDQFRQLVSALCPSIYGHEAVKAGLLLALFGGVARHTAHPSRVPVRGNIHVLVVGDPGLGKSQLLQAAAAASPRGLYVCGNTASGAGLTASVAKDPISGDFMFEAGAVVLADRGVCCVDEFDKMTSEHQSLLEAMEQQEVSVAKAGVMATLPARTAVLAAANPAGGRYRRGRSVAENLKGMSPALLSRFDLLFVLLDRPDAALDSCLSEHVMALHSGVRGRAEAARKRLNGYRPGSSSAAATCSLSIGGGASQMSGGGGGLGYGEAGGGPGQRPSLAQRLRLPEGGSHVPLLPVPLLKRYIAYARAHVFPSLSSDARQVLQDHYLAMRTRASPMDGTPVTARQLESLARLAEARARLDLREVVTRQDAEDAVDVMREALGGAVGGDDVPLALTVDAAPRPGSRGGRAAEAARFLGAARRVAARRGGDTLTTAELYSVANDISLQVADVAAFIAQLNDAGELLKNGSGVYRLNGMSGASQSQA